MNFRLAPARQLTAPAAWRGLPAWTPRLAFTPKGSQPTGDLLVVVFLRGAADVLNMLVPHGEEAYYALRPTLGIPRPDDNRAAADQRAIDLDGFFGLHPAMRPLIEPWQAGQLGIVAACGAPDTSRSHFKAMELMERGVEDERGPASGWLGRHLASLDTGNHSPLRAIGVGAQPQRSLRGSVPVSALRSISAAHLSGSPEAAAALQSAISALYQGGSSLDGLGQDTLDVVNLLQQLGASEGDTLPPGYPQTEFGQALHLTARLALADAGLEVAAIDLGGWDTHFAQGGSSGWMASLLAELSQGLAAFHSAMHTRLDKLSVVVQSEFGRRAYENGSLGTDHGHGSAMLLIGGGMRGGQVHGHWPGLQREQLFGPGDLAVTTDYRDVLAEICLKRLNNPALAAIFPGYSPSLPGVTR